MATETTGTTPKIPGQQGPAAAVPTSGPPPAALKAGSLGLVAVLFMAVANAAPITAVTANVPIAIAWGNGLAAPAGFVVATVILTLFAVGFVSMARHITTAGAFYGFITHGLGTVWGTASGALATMAYVVFEASLVGVFSYFAHDALGQWFGWDVNWLVLAAACIAVTAVLGYFDISLAAAVLGVFLVAEVVLLVALAASVVAHGGGPDGWQLGSLNPFAAFSGLPEGGGYGIQTGTPAALLPAGSGAIGLFFALWSWVGFETTAVYGEESKNPRRIVPRATLIAVVGLGAFYTLVSWLVIVGNGAQASVDKAANDSIGLFTGLAEANLGGRWVTDVYLFLIVSGSFACALAFHNAAARYLFAMGRDLPALRGSLGSTHPKHGSPHTASLVQTVVTALLTVGFYVLTTDGSDVAKGANQYQYALLALMGTMAILLVQAICSFAVVWYFQVKKVHRGSVWTTGVVPALGGLGMLYVIYLLFSNISFAGGPGSVSPFFTAIPYVVGACFVLPALGAVWLRRARPETYASLGRTVLEESVERS
ncbi:APC family permease [Quadrisphaera oryzae]|uniref:APC family permease n=1 Tax=Quadrisphaera TaxID=317661 RepID=UPI001C98DD11